MYRRGNYSSWIEYNQTGILVQLPAISIITTEACSSALSTVQHKSASLVISSAITCYDIFEEAFIVGL